MSIDDNHKNIYGKKIRKKKLNFIIMLIIIKRG